MSYGQTQSTWATETAQLYGADWALGSSAEILELAADSIASDYLHTDNRENVVESLHCDPSPENAASIAVDATLHAIKVIEDTGGNISL